MKIKEIVIKNDKKAKRNKKLNEKIAKVWPILPKINSTVGILAPRGSGKSQLCANLLNAYAEAEVFDHIYLFLGSPDKTYSVFKIPEEQIFHQYDDEIVKFIMKYHEENPKLRSLLLFDDMSGQIPKKSEFNTLATRGRHYGLTCFYCYQYAKDIPKVVRQNTQYWILLNNLQKEDKENMKGILPDYAFEAYELMEFTSRYNFLYVNPAEPFRIMYNFDGQLMPIKPGE